MLLFFLSILGQYSYSKPKNREQATQCYLVLFLTCYGKKKQQEVAQHFLPLLPKMHLLELRAGCCWVCSVASFFLGLAKLLFWFFTKVLKNLTHFYSPAVESMESWVWRAPPLHIPHWKFNLPEFWHKVLRMSHDYALDNPAFFTQLSLYNCLTPGFPGKPSEKQG